MNNITRYFILFLLIIVLVYSRLVGIDWGLPYAMHPDERNMVNAIVMLRCDSFSTKCFNPEFFAYGQLPLYLGFILKFPISYLYSGDMYQHVTLALRVISVLASIGTVYFLIKTVHYFSKPSNKLLGGLLFVLTFVPGFIQFSHFGTTESLLMFFYTVLLYWAIRFLHNDVSLRRYSAISGLVLGLALGTKVSALAFITIPGVVFLHYLIKHKTKNELFSLLAHSITFLVFTLIFFVITSPYNFIVWQDFLSSMNYESSVGLGTFKAFYTRQFEYSVPFIFQFVNIFPYSLGWPVFTLFILGFFMLPYNSKYNFLRIQFFLFLIPNSLLYAKWSRFVSPVFPIMVLFSFLMLLKLYSFLKEKSKYQFLNFGIIIILIVAMAIPGIAYTSIYLYSDVRFKASEWIYKNIPNGSYILSETANVVDVPIFDPRAKQPVSDGRTFTYISFNFYDLNVNPELQTELQEHIDKADFIFVPSRRVFANSTCYVPGNEANFIIQNFTIGYDSDRCAKLLKDYPEVNAYYDQLFSGKLGFEQVAEFSSFPRVELYKLLLIEFPDEMSEETWTVFDHPVMRIYKRK